MAEYIKREVLRKILENWRDAHADVDDEQGCGLLEDVICEVDAQPAADVAPVVHGRWLTWEEMFPGKTPKKKNNLGVFCGSCKNHADNMSDHCPKCGARMDSESDGNNQILEQEDKR